MSLFFVTFRDWRELTDDEGDDLAGSTVGQLVELAMLRLLPVGEHGR
jgi:hypothetical protein